MLSHAGPGFVSWRGHSVDLLNSSLRPLQQGARPIGGPCGTADVGGGLSRFRAARGVIRARRQCEDGVGVLSEKADVIADSDRPRFLPDAHALPAFDGCRADLNGASPVASVIH
ncbi:MAG TPA: hypothetical protein VL689_14590 [Paraburkholderia sp.]|nr:hypothetical protein [Paraburkholderia sp.]